MSDGLLNAGFQRGRPMIKTVGKAFVPTEFPTFAMAALAGIGTIPDTITSRAVSVHLRRRKPTEKVDPFRERRDLPQLHRVRDRFAVLLGAAGAQLADHDPDMDGLEDRPADAWQPLFMVADLAGAAWSKRVRTAARELVPTAAEDERDDSCQVRVLHDLGAVFAAEGDPAFLRTASILDRLVGIDPDEWPEHSFTGKRLGSLLRPFRIRSRRDATGTVRGYYRADFIDAWERYPVSPSDASEASEASEDQRAGSVPTRHLTFKVSDGFRSSDSVSDVLTDHPDTDGNGSAPARVLAVPHTNGVVGRDLLHCLRARRAAR